MSYVFSVSFVDVSKSISIKRGHEQEEEFGILRREKMTKTSLPELSNLFWLSANGTTRNAPRTAFTGKNYSIFA